MTEIIWLDEATILETHKILIDLFGGSHGVLNQDMDRLRATLDRPRNVLAYEDNPGICRLAASLGFGFAKNHCFNDGNKRMALTATEAFLELNGFVVAASEESKVVIYEGLANSSVSEDQFIQWLDSHCVPSL